MMRALPRIARAVSSNPDAYVYLAKSIRAWPDYRSWRNLTGRISPFTPPPNPCARPGQISKAAMLSRDLPGKYGWGVFGGGGVSGFRLGCGFARSFV
jgi:hypothetical protein